LANSQVPIDQVIEWLVQLYDEWGRKDKADEWRRTLLVMKSAGRLGLADLPADVFARP
jgi:hypothetical protein